MALPLPPMGRYLGRRLLALPLTLLAVAFAIFLLLSVVPGDPARLIVGPEATEEAYQAARARLGLDLPWPIRFGHWLGGIVRGDFGRSLSLDLSISRLIGSALSVTVPLALLTMATALIIAIPLGMAAATRPGSWLDLGTMGLAQLGMALPEFWLGILLVGFLAVRAGLFPSGGFPGWSQAGPALDHLILPALALALPRAAYLARMTRAAMADVLSAGYIQTARGKGVSELRVLAWHALRNALIPVVTTAGLTLGHLFAGAIVIENLFYLPGLGRLALMAVRARDLPLLSGVGLVVAGLMVTLSFAVDLVYGLLDPRIRYQ